MLTKRRGAPPAFSGLLVRRQHAVDLAQRVAQLGGHARSASVGGGSVARRQGRVQGLRGGLQRLRADGAGQALAGRAGGAAPRRPSAAASRRAAASEVGLRARKPRSMRR